MKTILNPIALLFTLQAIGQGTGWQPQQSGTTRWLSTIQFTDSLTGWAVGDSGTLLKTTNGGNTWLSQNSGTTNPLHGMHFIDPMRGWIVGGNGVLMKTTNAGASWQSQNSDIANCSSVHFSDSLHGTVAGWTPGWRPGCMITDNGGQTWYTVSNLPLGCAYTLNEQTRFSVYRDDHEARLYKIDSNSMGNQPINLPIISDRIYDIFFINAQTGWLVGLFWSPANTHILKTTDGGQTWQVQISGTENYLNSVHFINEQTGWIVGNNGIILNTRNGGETWELQPSGTTNDLYSVHFTDSLNGWIVGANGTILHTSTGGLTPIHKTLVSSPTLSLYPNPAEEWVTLQTSSPIQSIRVSDALGRHIQVPPLEARGLCISTWKPGLYQVKIQTAEGAAVQRVVKR